MMSLALEDQTPVAPPSYQRAQARLGPALHINALTLVTTLHLLMLCRMAVRLAHRRCPPHCQPVLAEPRVPTVRRACCSSACCVPCGAYRIRTRTTGSRVGRVGSCLWVAIERRGTTSHSEQIPAVQTSPRRRSSPA
jgi:hypothetical protein